MEPLAWVSAVFVLVIGGGLSAIIWWSLQRGRSDIEAREEGLFPLVHPPSMVVPFEQRLFLIEIQRGELIENLWRELVGNYAYSSAEDSAMLGEYFPYVPMRCLSQWCRLLRVEQSMSYDALRMNLARDNLVAVGKHVYLVKFLLTHGRLCPAGRFWVVGDPTSWALAVTKHPEGIFRPKCLREHEVVVGDYVLVQPLPTTPE